MVELKKVAAGQKPAGSLLECDISLIALPYRGRTTSR